MIETTMKREPNPGMGLFSVLGKEVVLRRASEEDIKPVVKLINTEFCLSTLDFMLRKPEVLERIKALPVPHRPFGYDNNRMAMLYPLYRAAKSPEPFIDAVDSAEVYGWVASGLSVVAVPAHADGGQAGTIAAHMCGRDLGKNIGLGGYVEITAGIVDPEFRGRGLLQNMMRYALLSEIAGRYPEGTKIISVSKQDSVSGPLEVSGFRKMDSTEELQKLRPIMMDADEKWVVRVESVREWKRFIEREGIASNEDYNETITRYLDAAKGRAQAALRR